MAIYGYRAWRLCEYGNFLLALAIPVRWHKTMRAQCLELSSLLDNEKPIPLGPAPHYHCRCGIYAYNIDYTDDIYTAMRALIASGRHKTLSDGIYDFLGYYLDSDVVWGYVWLWGRIIEHEWGYRAQYARMLTLFLPYETPHYKEINAELRDGYECEVIGYSLPHIKSALLNEFR